MEGKSCGKLWQVLQPQGQQCCKSWSRVLIVLSVDYSLGSAILSKSGLKKYILSPHHVAMMTKKAETTYKVLLRILATPL